MKSASVAGRASRNLWRGVSGGLESNARTASGCAADAARRSRLVVTAVVLLAMGGDMAEAAALPRGDDVVDVGISPDGSES